MLTYEKKEKNFLLAMGKSSHREDEKGRWGEGADGVQSGRWLLKGFGLDVACFQGK